MKARTFIGMAVMLVTLTGMTACSSTDLPVSDDSVPSTELLYGEWWLVGWNSNGTWFEVDTNFVSHRHMSLEFQKVENEIYIFAWSMANEIYIGKLLNINGNELVMDSKGAGSTMVLSSREENLFFEDNICDIKSCKLMGNQLRLYYTDEDYFVFTKDFDDSDEFFYAWKNGPADAFVGEVTSMSDEEVEVKVISSPSFVSSYSRAAPPKGNREICHFAASDLTGRSFKVGDKVAFRIIQYKRLNYYGTEYMLKVRPCKGFGHITNRTGTIFKDKQMGWMIIDDEKNEKQRGIYYYPLKDLPKCYLADGQSVVFSGELYPTWRFPSGENDYSDNYYLDIEAIELVSPSGAIVAIDEVNFPDAEFRNWLATNYKWANDGLLTEKEIEEVTSIEISRPSVKSLKGIELLRNLTSLKATDCDLNKVDVSKNTKLAHLDLDNTHLTSIDLSNNLKLKFLSLRRNQLKIIDLSKNTELEEVYLERNLLTSLDLTGLRKLAYVYCYQNRINGEAMDVLIASLSTEYPDTFCVINTHHHTERNVVTKSQVATAIAKGWKVLDWNNGEPQEYLGSDR